MKSKIIIAAMAVMLAACGKPQDREMISDANAQHVPAAEYLPAGQVKGVRTEGCLVASPDGGEVYNLLEAQAVRKFGSESITIRMVGRSDTFDYGNRRDEAYVEIIRQWVWCINNLGRGGVTFVRDR